MSARVKLALVEARVGLLSDGLRRKDPCVWSGVDIELHLLHQFTLVYTYLHVHNTHSHTRACVHPHNWQGMIFIFIFLLVAGANVVVNLLVAVIMLKFSECKVSCG